MARTRDYEDGYDAALAEAATASDVMSRKLRDMERLFWAAVAASGGTVAVPRSLLYRFDNPKWSVMEDVANDRVVYKVTV